MLGRGTRLCPDLFAPGDDKRSFSVFDFCQNLEYFSQEVPPAEGGDQPSLSQRIFTARLELVGQFDTDRTHSDERAEVAGVLQETVASMNTDNFLVRPHLELVEKFARPEVWQEVTIGDLATLADRVAPLPAQLQPEHEDAKRFDVLLLNTQLSALRGEPFDREQNKIRQIAGQLEQQRSIPVIDQQIELILDVQTDEWWEDVTYPMLEGLRKRLRGLVPLIEKRKRIIVTLDVEDEIGVGTEVILPGTEGTTGEWAQFRRKTEQFLRDNLGEYVVAKLRNNEPITHDDEQELQRLLVAAGIGDDDDFETASERAGSLGLFVRSLIGLDRSAAKAVFNDFLDDRRYSRNQIQFVNLVIDYLTEHGVVDPARVYEQPFTGVAPQGPDALFTSADLDRLFDGIEQVKTAAGGAGE